MSDPAAALAQSVHSRLTAHAKSVGLDANLVLSRFASERLLYRLSRSPHEDRFILKGAMMLLVWLGETTRPTRDIDLLGFGDLSFEALAEIFREVCSVPVEPDGATFDPASVAVAAIRREDPYGGRRVTLRGNLGRARLLVQVDVGIGDSVVPEPVRVNYPTLLGLPAPALRAYRPETSIAEKLHAMATLGMSNSRMRDFFDIDALAKRETFDGRVLVEAVRATFARRGTPLPEGLPVALTPAFATSAEKRAQWEGFLKKNGLSKSCPELADMVGRLVVFLDPILAAARDGQSEAGSWRAGGSWTVEGLNGSESGPSGEA